MSHLLAGDVPGNALARTAWGSSHLPGSRERPADYLAVAALPVSLGGVHSIELVGHEIVAALPDRIGSRDLTARVVRETLTGVAARRLATLPV